MYTLFIDTHATNTLLILYKDNNLYKIKNKESNSQSEVIMPTLIELLEEENLTVDNLSKIAVVIGPGSFTGIRIGLSTIKAIAQVKNLEIFSINSLELIAYTTFVKKGLQNNTNIISIISTNNDRVFYCIYNISIKNEKLVSKGYQKLSQILVAIFED